jgi:CheY-like chemotaxis protein
MTQAHKRSSRILVVDADPALLGLLEEWLGEQGCLVVAEGGDPQHDGFDLAVVDIPFPRQGGTNVLKRIASEHPGTPVFALSSSFFARIESCGAVARTLGVARVLPKPLARDALVAAVRKLLDEPK